MKNKILLLSAKKIIFISVTAILFFLGVHKSYGQLEIGHHFKIKNNYKYGGRLELKYKENDTATITKYIYNESNDLECKCGNLKAYVFPDSSGKIKVEFWSITDDIDSIIGSKIYVNSNDSFRNFHIETPDRYLLSDPKPYISLPYAVTEVGAITLPFKYRFGNNGNNIPNNASTDFNAGIYFGRKWGRKRFYHNKDLNHESIAFTLALFAGPTSINVKKENVKDTLRFTKESNEIALSGGGGFFLSYRRVNIGTFVGFDFPFSAEGQNWIYANKLWLGFGVGYSLKFLHGNQ